MNWKAKLCKPFAVGDIVETSSGSNYKVLAMEGGNVSIESVSGGRNYTGTEKEYFNLLTKVR